MVLNTAVYLSLQCSAHSIVAHLLPHGSPEGYAMSLAATAGAVVHIQ